ncbi:unnamed protein product [Dovyalis caffra]|uniref:Uncharacterized protein n=1 Tax=Dovyalis caffra TaxID=77055 RepID=A0AAV1SU73_9ROSI|nr:unnamed protein product [Dovyalis caffra]
MERKRKEGEFSQGVTEKEKAEYYLLRKGKEKVGRGHAWVGFPRKRIESAPLLFAVVGSSLQFAPLLPFTLLQENGRQISYGYVETGTADHANTSTSRGVTRANVVGTRGPEVILEVLVGAVAHPLGSPGRMFAQVTGTALPATVGPTTLLAAQVASNVECTRKLTQPGALILTLPALEGLVGVLLEVAIDLDGNPGIGFALGGDATNITLQAEWSALSAMPQETLATELHTRYNFSISGLPAGSVSF